VKKPNQLSLQNPKHNGGIERGGSRKVNPFFKKTQPCGKLKKRGRKSQKGKERLGKKGLSQSRWEKRGPRKKKKRKRGGSKERRDAGNVRV